MEVNAEKGFAKYSKLVKENVLEGTMDNQNKAETKNNNYPANVKIEDFGLDFKRKIKGYQSKLGLKTLIGLILTFLMIVSGLIAGLFIMNLKIQKSQHQINQGFKAQNENILQFLTSNITDTLNISKTEIESLKQDIQALFTQNQKSQHLIDQGFKAQNENILQFLTSNITDTLNKTKIGSLKQDIQALFTQNQKLREDLEELNVSST